MTYFYFCLLKVDILSHDSLPWAVNYYIKLITHYACTQPSQKLWGVVVEW